MFGLTIIGSIATATLIQHLVESTVTFRTYDDF